MEHLIINGVNLIPRALSLPRLRKTGETGNYVTCNDEVRKIFSQGSIKLKLKINIFVTNETKGMRPIHSLLMKETKPLVIIVLFLQ